MLKPLIAFDYWGLPIYLILVLIGVGAAAIHIYRVENKLGCSAKNKRMINRSFWLAFPLALVVSNLANWFLFPDLLETSWIYRLSQGGFSFYYGMLAFFGFAALFLKVSRLPSMFWINQFVPSMLIFHAFGRVGCSLSGCCYGKEIVLLGFPIIFPAREIEALALFFLYRIFIKKIRTDPFFWYLTSYSILRFFLEFGRGDDRGILFVSFLSPAQVTSILIWIGLVFYLLVKRVRRGSKADATTLTSTEINP